MAGCPHGLELPYTGLLATPHACPQHTSFQCPSFPLVCAPSFPQQGSGAWMQSHECDHMNGVTELHADTHRHPLLSFQMTHHKMYFLWIWLHPLGTCVTTGTSASSGHGLLFWAQVLCTPPVSCTPVICHWAPLLLWPPPPRPADARDWGCMQSTGQRVPPYPSVYFRWRSQVEACAVMPGRALDEVVFSEFYLFPPLNQRHGWTGRVVWGTRIMALPAWCFFCSRDCSVPGLSLACWLLLILRGLSARKLLVSLFSRSVISYSLRPHGR